MIIKKILIGTALILALGTTTIAFAKENNSNRNATENDRSDINNSTIGNSMYSMMEQYGYGDLVQDMKGGNYTAMNNFMNNLSDEDYQKMIDIMKDYGYTNMAVMMKSIGKEGMIARHNSMGGATSCHR